MMMTIETDPGWSTTMPLTVRHLQVVTSRDIEHSLLESVTSSSQQCRYAVRWPTPQCVTRNVSRGSEGTSLADREQSAGSAGSKVENLEAYSDADWGGDKATRRSVSGGVIMRGGQSQGVDQEAASGIAVFR